MVDYEKDPILLSHLESYFLLQVELRVLYSQE